MTSILNAAAVVSSIGLIFGVLLGFASKIFAVEQDEKLPLILETLPGANCGGCGFAGCSQFAENVLAGNAKPNGCPVGGAEVAKAVAAILGVEAEVFEKKAAFVVCSGSEGVAEVKYLYEGNLDCLSASKLAGGQKACGYSCLGYGTCVHACKFGAISIKDNLAVVDTHKCTACGACVEACPRNVITIICKTDKYIVKCQNKDKAADLKLKCAAGCIGCKICEKNCPAGAVTVNNFLASIDKDKCTECGLCAEKCPKKIIRAAVI
jgi:Na+-translocating ferredoxin:NAD+ oxidoreductase RNF subunit RnfB